MALEVFPDVASTWQDHEMLPKYMVEYQKKHTILRTDCGHSEVRPLFFVVVTVVVDAGVLEVGGDGGVAMLFASQKKWEPSTLSRP